ncbi:MAG: cytochrome c oxidase assembly protein [Nostocoides sp.]
MWSLDPIGVLLPLVLSIAYAGLLAVRRTSWPAWRTVCWFAGVAVLAWSLLGAPAARRADTSWWGAAGIALVAAVAPLGLALGDPIGLWEKGRRPVAWIRRRVVRAVTFPLVASGASAALLTIAFTGGWYASARRHDGPWTLLVLSALGVGLLVNLPLLSDDLLPTWCGPGMRTLLAFVDGLFDAIPGIVVMTTVERFTGGALLSIAESVGIPMIFAVLLQWVRSDERDAREIDARLDASEAEGVHDGTPWWLKDA